MSATLPPGLEQLARREGEAGATERERALMLELRTLRAENAYLRQRYARQLGGEPAANSSGPGAPPEDLPLPLEPTGAGAPVAPFEYEALFNALGSVFPIGIFRTDEAGLLTHVDAQLLQICGMQRDELPNFGWLKNVHPDDAERVQAHWVRVISRGEALSIEFRLLRAGEVRHLIARNAPLRDAQGVLTGQLGFVQDITTLRVLEAESRIKEELNRQIIASSPDCTKVLDLAGRLVQITEQGRRLVEVDDFEQIRLSDWTSWWPEEGATLAREAVAAAGRGESSRFVAYGTTFKGTPKWWDTAVTPISDNLGEPVMLLVISRDITEQHRQQEEIRRFNAELEKRVRERTDELADAKERVSMALTEAQSLYNGAPCGYHSLDASGTFVLMNRTELEWLGYERHEVVGQLHLRDVVLPEQLDFALGRLRDLVMGGKIEPAEMTMRRRDGSSFVALVSSTAVRDQKGRFVRTNNTLIDITARKQAEEALAVQTRFLQAVTDTVPVQLAYFDRDLVCRLANKSYARWRSGTPGEVVGLHLRDIAQPQDYNAALDRLQAALQGVPQRFEGERSFPDGHRFYASIEYTPFVVNGEVQGIIIQMLDITERKTAEDTQREQQRFLERITDQVPGLIAYLDAGLHFRFANAEHQRLYGMDPQQILGRHIRDCVPPGEWADIAPHMVRALAGSPQHFETWRQTVDGQPIFISANYLPDMDADGRARGLFVQIIDITERKRIEERVSHLNEELELRIQERSAELLESEQRFRLMVDNLRDYCIFFMDANGFITDWTDSAQRMDGYSPVQMLGRHYGVLFDPGDPEAGKLDAERMLRLAASRGQHDVQGWLTRKDGSRYWSHSVLIALRDQKGDLKGFAKINRDMTDAKQLDDLMHNINDELEKRVVERTEQLLAANRDLESFSYSVSHDLRSPLRHISSFVSLLEEHLGTERDETTTRYLATIGNSARHMSQLIDGLLAFSRLGRAAVNIAPVDFNHLVSAVVSQIAHDTDGRVVDWHIAPDLPLVHGDALLLREVWANLLGNAFKYTRPRERAVIDVSWNLEPVRGYVFSIRDNGVGFDTKYSQKLFGVFQRLHRASEFEGTGIGLALTRRIIERHGGSVWAESRLGEGSVFHFSLPIDGPRLPDTTDSMPAPLEP
ncbi:PAS domain S-box protein [Hydrogenophaga sp. T2]|uniref:PAS domain S-box protein n=1 Tax=Hydrogenophaga sp. T2 TaxID=3132823 RepID=UPI003CEBFBB2